MIEVTELVTKFSFTGSLKPLDGLNKGLTSAISGITKVTGVLSVASVALNGFLASTLAGADAQVQLSRETGVSMEAIQEWGYVASVNGSSAENLERSLDGLSKKMGEATIENNEVTKSFQKLGITLKNNDGKMKSSEVVLSELAVAFKKLNLSSSEQKAYLEKLGIDESMLQTLQLGADGIDKLREKARALGVVSTADANSIASFNDSLTTLKYGVDSVQKRIAVSFAPQLGALADGFTDLLIANRDMIQHGLKKFFELVNTGLGAIFRFGKMLFNLIDNTVGFENALMVASAAMLYLNRAMFLNPVGAIIAGITALVVVFDDLAVGLAGGKSMISDWFKEWFDIDVISLIKDIERAFGELTSFITSSFDATFSAIESGLDNTVGFFKDMINQIMEFFKPLLNAMDNLTNFKVPSLDSINPFKQSWSLSDLNPFADEPKKLATATIGATNKNSTQNNNINIEIKTDNPKMAGEAVSKELKGMLDTASVQFGKGGL